MPEIAITIKGKDLASDVLGKIEDVGVEAFQSIESAAAGAAGAVEKAGAETADANRELQQTKGMEIPWDKLAVAAAAAGIALESLAQKAAADNEALDKLSVSTGLTSDSLRQLALDTATATDDVGEMVDLFTLAGQRGAETTQQLQSFATFWDTVADAVGGNATALAQYSSVLQAVGVGLGEEEQALAALGYAQTQTTIGVEGLLSAIQRGGPEFKALALSINDAAAVMGILESRGIMGRAAMGEFNKAANEAKGSQSEFFNALGITNAELDTYRQKVADSAGAIGQLAAVEAEHHTLMERINNTLSEVSLKYGETIEVMGSLAPVMIGLSATLGVMGRAWGPLVAAMPALGTAATAAGAAIMASLGTILLVLAGLAVAAVALYLAWQTNFGNIRGITETVLSGLGDAFAVVKDDIVGAVTEIWDVISPTFTAIADLLSGLGPIIDGAWAPAWQAAYAAAATVVSLLYSVVKSTLGNIWGVFKWLGEMIGASMSMIVNFIFGSADTIFQGGRELIAVFQRGILAAASELYAAIKGVVENVWALLSGGDLKAVGKEMASGLMAGMSEFSLDGLKEKLKTALSGLGAIPSVIAKEEGKKIPKAMVEGIKEGQAEAITAATAAASAVATEYAAMARAGFVLNLQRQVDNMTRLEQLEAQRASELAIVTRAGEDTSAVESYYANAIAEEKARLREQNFQDEQRVQQLSLQTTLMALETQASMASGMAEIFSALYKSSGDQARSLFEIAKAFAIAEALINAHKAATMAMADVTIPSTVARMALAAIVYGKAIAEVSAIASQKPALAAGGIVTRPMEALIGEAGPEAVIPLDRWPMGGNTTVVVEIIGGIWTTRPETAQELARYIRPYLDREAAR